VRAPAVAPTPKRDPVVYLSGGPGGAGSFEVAFMVKHGLNADREVIFVDQRAARTRAGPRVGCSASEQFGYDSVSLPFAAGSTTAADAKAIKDCYDRWVATGVNLAAYNSTGERCRHRRPQAGTRHRTQERLRGLVRIDARADRLARSPGRHSQRDPRFGVAPH
jgi:hypothetical protein